MNAKMRAVEKRINGVKGKIVVKQYLATVYDYVCQYCGKEFDSTKKNRKFCCRECCRKSANKNQEAICPICGKTFFVNCNKKYCSVDCANKRNREAEKQLKICAYCGKEYVGHKCSKYCSEKCKKAKRDKQQNENHKEIRRILKESGFSFNRCKKHIPRVADMRLLVECVAFIRSITLPTDGFDEIMEKIKKHPFPI